MRPRRNYGRLSGTTRPIALKFAKKLASPEMAKYPRVTLIYAARDEKENEAVVLQKWLPAHE